MGFEEAAAIMQPLTKGTVKSPFDKGGLRGISRG
jgi:hypothetical protein